MIALLWWAGGCGSAECGPDRESCPLGTSCEDGQCVTRLCASSLQCPLEYHCTRAGECASGCAVDDDCAVGRACDTDGTCVETPCVDAAIDCRFGQWCVSGTCVDAGDPYCQACTTDAECGAGNICWADEWCGVDCSVDPTCPAALSCTHVDHSDGLPHEVCLGACWIVPPP